MNEDSPAQRLEALAKADRGIATIMALRPNSFGEIIIDKRTVDEWLAFTANLYAQQRRLEARIEKLAGDAVNTKPDFVDGELLEEIVEYLDGWFNETLPSQLERQFKELQRASPWLHAKARACLSYWIRTYRLRHEADDAEAARAKESK